MSGRSAAKRAGRAPDAQRLRDGLVGELRGRGVIRSDSVAFAFAAVPRERFIPDVLFEHGLEAVYRDRAYPIKHDPRGMPLSSSSQPAIMAEMLELLDVEPGHRILEVGAGTGYNAALLAQLVGAGGRVTSVDVDPQLCRRARAALRETGYKVNVRHADGRAGFAQDQPYDRIIVTASAEALRRAWLEQLTERGRVIVPLRLDPDADAIQLIPVLERRGQRLRSLDLTWGGFMPLHGGDGGWQAPRAALTANRTQGGSHSSLISITGTPVGRLSAGAAQRLLAATLSTADTRRQGWSPLVRGHTPEVLIYLLVAIPAAQRVWVRRRRWHGIGMVDPQGRGLATVTVRSVWESKPVGGVRRARWRLHGYGDSDRICTTLERVLDRWRALERAGQHQTVITARPAGDEMTISMRWQQAGREPRRRDANPAA